VPLCRPPWVLLIELPLRTMGQREWAIVGALTLLSFFSGMYISVLTGRRGIDGVALEGGASTTALIESSTGRGWRRGVELRELGIALRVAKFDCLDKLAFIRYKTDALVVEVGAFDGRETLQIALAPQVRRVVSFEPTSAKHGKIVKKLEDAGVMHKVDLRQQAASDVADRVKFHVYRGAWAVGCGPVVPSLRCHGHSHGHG
jgi:hypothetical protein